MLGEPEVCELVNVLMDAWARLLRQEIEMERGADRMTRFDPNKHCYPVCPWTPYHQRQWRKTASPLARKLPPPWELLRWLQSDTTNVQLLLTEVASGVA